MHSTNNNDNSNSIVLLYQKIPSIYYTYILYIVYTYYIHIIYISTSPLPSPCLYLFPFHPSPLLPYVPIIYACIFVYKFLCNISCYFVIIVLFLRDCVIIDADNDSSVSKSNALAYVNSISCCVV